MDGFIIQLKRSLDNSMKVAAFIINLSKGGAQGVFVNVVNYLYDVGIDIDIVVQNLDDSVYKKKINPLIHIENLDSPSAKKMLPALRAYLVSHRFTHALVFGPEIAVDLFLMRKRLHKDYKIISRCLNTLTQEYTYATSFFRKYVTSLLIRCVYPKMDMIVAQSKGMAKDLTEKWNIVDTKVVVINNALQPEYESEVKSDEENLKEDYVMFAGRLEPQKGVDMLLKAFYKLNNKSVSLKIIGDGSQRGKLKLLAAELNLSDRVEFINYTQNIKQYYKTAKAVLMTSYFEGFPNVLVEAIACGTPVISYDLPSGPKEIIIEGVNGQLIPYLDVEAFSKSLDLALTINWDEKKVKETACRFMREQIMPRYIEVLEKV